MSNFWKKLCTYRALKDGWHLTLRDLKEDFIEILFLLDQVASSLDANLKELVRQLKTEQFRHQNVIRTAVSKRNYICLMVLALRCSIDSNHPST